MQSAWVKNLKTKEEQERFFNTLQGARPVLERLDELLTEKQDTLDRTERTIKAYDNPNWAYQQAHKNGCASMLTAIKELINLDQQREIQQ